jgi:hypothetical protein
MTTTSVNQFTSSLLLTVMSADRYIAVCHPIDAATVRTPFYAKVSPPIFVLLRFKFSFLVNLTDFISLDVKFYLLYGPRIATFFIDDKFVPLDFPEMHLYQPRESCSTVILIRNTNISPYYGS